MLLRFRTGLVVGKFCPLHLGHERLVAHALAACEVLWVLSYTKPGYAGCGTAARAAWLLDRCPAARSLVLDDTVLAAMCAEHGLPARELPNDTAADDVHRDFVAWVCLELLAIEVDAVFTSEDYGDGFAARLQAHSERVLGRPHPVRHVCVDRERRVVGARGTAIRGHLHANHDQVSARVRADLVGRVAIVGGESSGKTTLAEALARRFGTCAVGEYGRALWVEREGLLTLADMTTIASTQVAREQAAAAALAETEPEAPSWLFCDTTPLVTAFYSRSQFGRVEALVAALAGREYDLHVLCQPDFAFVQDGTRQGAAFSRLQHRWLRLALRRRGIGFVSAAGPIDARVNTVARALAALPPCFSPLPAGTGRARPDT